MEMPLEKYLGFNFYKWKVKIHMQLMNKNLWEIIKGIEETPADLNKLIEWKSRDDEAKTIIGLSLSNLEIHHVDLEKSSEEI
jgi:Mg2+/Co2+ transporter CorB